MFASKTAHHPAAWTSSLRWCALVCACVGTSACGVEDPETPLAESEHNQGHAHGATPDGGEPGDSGGAKAGRATIDATTPMAWTYWDFSIGKVVSVSDASSSTAWDLAFQRALLATNSGTSRSGDPTMVGALDTGSTDWDATDACPTDGYRADESLPVAGPPGSGEYSGNPALAEWFDYDMATHAVSSKQRIYCIRTVEGDYAKFVVLSYAGGNWSIRWQVL